MQEMLCNGHTVLILYSSAIGLHPAAEECITCFSQNAHLHVGFMDLAGGAVGPRLAPFDAIILLDFFMDAWAVGGNVFPAAALAAFSGLKAYFLQDYDVKSPCRTLDAVPADLLAGYAPEDVVRRTAGERLRAVPYVSLSRRQGIATAVDRFCAVLKAMLPPTPRARIVWGMCGARPRGGGDETVKALTPTGSYPAFMRREYNFASQGHIVSQRFAQDNLYGVPSNFIKRVMHIQNCSRMRDFLPAVPSGTLLSCLDPESTSLNLREMLWN